MWPSLTSSFHVARCDLRQHSGPSSASTIALCGQTAFHLCVQQLMDVWLLPHSAVISAAALGIGERASMDTCLHFSRVDARSGAVGSYGHSVNF